MKAGKAYAHTKAKSEKPKGDFYPTPKSLIWTVSSLIKNHFPTSHQILEPCSGNGSISKELIGMGYDVFENDISFGCDYLQSSFNQRFVITNPPFSLWDEFVEKSKSHCEKVMMIGRLNYFGTESRMRSGIWNHLREVHCFNRYVDYRTPERDDGMFHVGAMATAWFFWDMKWNQNAATIHFVDVNGYARLGNLKEEGRP